MTKVAGRQVEIGVGIESTPGTSVTPTVYPQWNDFSLQATAEKSNFNSARGIRHAVSDSRIRRKMGEGSIGVVPNVQIAPYLFDLALGVLNTSTVDGETSVYDHTFTTQNEGSAMKTGTFVVKHGGVVTEEYTNVVVNSLNLEVSDDWATMTAELLSKFPTTGQSLTASYTKETQFNYSDLTVRFGSDLSTAENATAKPLKGFTLNINNNVMTDEAFLSGSNEPVDGGFVAGNQEVTGSYTLQFEDTTELEKYKNNTKEAVIAQFTGASIGSAETEKITIQLGRLILTSPPKEYNMDGLIILSQEFTVEHDSTDGNITAVVTNEDDGTNY